VLTALLRQVLTLLLHRVANRVANFAASDVASRDYHLVANPVLTMLLTTLRTLLLRMLPCVVTTLLPRRCQPDCPTAANCAANRKNLLLWWRYWLVGAASEPLRLRVTGGRRWPAY